MMRLPNAANSEEEALRVYNEDLRSMSPSELEHEIWRVSRLAARDPGAFVWRGLEHISMRQYADERVCACRALLVAPERPRRHARSMAWAR